MKISAVYITKNEELNIAKSINSYKKIADEIIIVDTGSTDKTIEICKNLGCKVFYYKWVNDFSKARNYAISLCSNEIIIFLDADEYFISELGLQEKDIIINAFLNDKKLDALACNEIDIEKETGEQHHSSFTYKIFRNSKDLFFKEKIHEYLFKKTGKLNIGLLDSHFQLIHTGYSKDVSKDKVIRNLQILNTITNKSTMEYFYTARENLSLGNYEEADYNIDKFFSQKNFKKCIKNSNIAYLGYFYKTIIMKHLDEKYSSQDILKLLKKAKKQIGHIPEVYFRLGLYYYDIDIDKSFKYFKKCIKKNEKFNKDFRELNNFVGFQSNMYYFMSKILALQNKKNEAISKSIVACMLNKKDKNNLCQLLHLLNRKKTEENIQLIYRIYNPKTIEDYEFILGCLSNTNLCKEFVKFAYDYNKEMQGGNSVLYYAMMLTGDSELALETLFKNEKCANDFIATIILLYTNSLDLFYKYKNRLSKNYQDIINALSTKNFSDYELNTEIMSDLLCKLANYGITDYDSETKEFICSNFKPQEILKLGLIYINNRQYDKAIEILSEYRNKNCLIVYNLLASLLDKKEFNKFIEVYNKYFYILSGSIVQIKLLNLVPIKDLDRTHYRIFKQLIKKEKKNAKI